MFWHAASHYTDLVDRAYSDPASAERQLIGRRFRQWIGLEHGILPRIAVKKFIRRIFKATKQLAASQPSRRLGECAIGFGDLRIEAYASDSNTASVFLFGASDNLRLFEIYRQYCRPASTAVDVGANVGMHSLVFSHLVGNEGRVFSFEPSPRILQRAAENIRLNPATNIELISKALGSAVGTVGFLDLADQANIGESRVRRDAAGQVAMDTLDNVLATAHARNVSLVKIDVEGFEREVLQGAQDTLRNEKPTLVIECNLEQYELKEMLDAIPYACDVYAIPYSFREPLEQVARAGKVLPNTSMQRNSARTFDALIVPAG